MATKKSANNDRMKMISSLAKEIYETKKSDKFKWTDAIKAASNQLKADGKLEGAPSPSKVPIAKKTNTLIKGVKSHSKPHEIEYSEGGVAQDKKLTAKKAGLRKSKKFATVEMKGGEHYRRRNNNQFGVEGGNEYYESRENRSDKNLTKRFAGGGVAGKKKSKIAKPTDEDLARKAKVTGFRFKTDQLKKKNGELSELGKKLKYKRPTAAEVDKYKRVDGEYPNKKLQVYDERRNDRKHSDDNLRKKFEEGGQAGEVPSQYTVCELETMFGRSLNYPNEFINGVKYTKRFMHDIYVKSV